MFLRQIVETFLERTIPDSSMAKPAAINITNNPHITNKNELKINPTSGETLACTCTGNAMIANILNSINGNFCFLIKLYIFSCLSKWNLWFRWHLCQFRLYEYAWHLREVKQKFYHRLYRLF